MENLPAQAGTTTPSDVQPSERLQPLRLRQPLSRYHWGSPETPWTITATLLY